MPRLSSTVLAVLALVAVVPAADAAWEVRTVASDGPAFSRAVAVGPGGRVATVLELGASGERTLELREGRRRTELARTPHGYGSVSASYDVVGRLTVVFNQITSRRGTRHMYAYSDDSTQRLTRGRSSVNVASWAAAPDGGAVLAYYQQDRAVRVVRRPPGAARFGAPETLAAAGTADAFPAAAIARGGRVVVAFGTRAARAAGPTEPFGSAASLTSSETKVDRPAVTIDDRGDAIVAFSGRRDGARRVEAVRWPAADPTPAAPLVLSERAKVGGPVALATSGATTVAFREADDPRRQALLRTVVLRPDGSSDTAAVRFRGGTGGRLSITRAGRGARVWGSDARGTAAVAVLPDARLGPVETVMRDRNVFFVDPAEAAGRLVAVWTTRSAPTNAAWRVRIAVRRR